jgi:hypothetical protein
MLFMAATIMIQSMGPQGMMFCAVTMETTLFTVDLAMIKFAVEMIMMLFTVMTAMIQSVVMQEMT